jgi:hypothetical protein
MSGIFDTVDEVLDKGGQTALNTASIFLPHAASVPINGAQAVYHGAHAARDVSEGNYREACSQGAEALAHVGMMHPVVGKPAELACWGFDALANGINLFGMGEGQTGGPRNQHGRVASLPGQIGNKVADLLGLEDHGSPHAHYAD